MWGNEVCCQYSKHNNQPSTRDWDIPQQHLVEIIGTWLLRQEEPMLGVRRPVIVRDIMNRGIVVSEKEIFNSYTDIFIPILQIGMNVPHGPI